MTPLFIRNYSSSKLYPERAEGPMCLFSFEGRISSLDWRVFSRRRAGFYMQAHVYGSFSLIQVFRAVATKKKKRKARERERETHTSFSLRWNADKSVWSPRRSRRLWKSRETGAYVSTGMWETQRRTLQKPLHSPAQLWYPSSPYCSPATLLTMVWHCQGEWRA